MSWLKGAGWESLGLLLCVNFTSCAEDGVEFLPAMDRFRALLCEFCFSLQLVIYFLVARDLGMHGFHAA